MDNKQSLSVAGGVLDDSQLDQPQLIYLYTLYDKVAKDSAPPFGAVNDQIAIRKVCQLLVDNPMPEDYTLYKVGIYSPGVPCIEDVLMDKIPFLSSLDTFQAAIKVQRQRRTLREIPREVKL